MCSIRDIFPTKARRVNVILATHRQTLKRRAPGKHRGLPHSAEAAGNYSCYVLIYFKQLRSMYIYSCSRSLITARVARRAAMFSSLSVCLSVCLFPYLLQSLTLLFSSLFICLLLHYLSSSATLLFVLFSVLHVLSSIF